MRASDGTSITNPHSRPSTGLSELNQAIAMRETNASFSVKGTPEARYSGSRESQGLNVKKSMGFRATERMTTGATRSKTETAAVTPQNTLDRARMAAAS